MTAITDPADDAETILRAAELMRHRAQAGVVIGGEASLWHLAVDLDGVETWSHDVITTADAEHIAGMSPDFGLAVAAWLRACGGELDRSGEYDACDEPASIRIALRIARAYLQEAS